MEQEIRFAKALAAAIDAGGSLVLDMGLVSVVTSAGAVQARIVTHGPGGDPSLEDLRVGGESVMLAREHHATIIDAFNRKALVGAADNREVARLAQIDRLTQMLEEPSV